MDQLRDELLALWQRQGMTIDDLVEEVERLLPAVADRQTRYKVTERPDVRTIRFYVSKGLLPRAAGYEAGRARYGGTHLLRLLLVKKLQAEQHSLARIGAILEGADDRRVLALILGRDPGEMQSAPGGDPPAAFASHAMLRINLPESASLDVPGELMSSQTGREALASALESAAAWLRSEARFDSEQGE